MHIAQYTEVEELLTRRGMSGEDSIAANWQLTGELSNELQLKYHSDADMNRLGAKFKLHSNTLFAARSNRNCVRKVIWKSCFAASTLNNGTSISEGFWCAGNLVIKTVVREGALEKHRGGCGGVCGGEGKGELVDNLLSRGGRERTELGFSKTKCSWIITTGQGCISCGLCSYPELTEDHVLPSA